MARKSAAPRTGPDDDLVPLKVPRWVRRLVLQVSAQTEETAGQIVVRLMGDPLRSDHAAKVAPAAPKRRS